MDHTVEQIDKKIMKLKETIDFWQKAREVVSNPLFAELSSGNEEVIFSSAISRLPRPIPVDPVPQRSYGQIKKLALDFLPADRKPVTPQELVTMIESTGFVFSTKTPAISINDALRVLADEGRVKTSGKSAANANLWVRISDTEKGDTEVTP